jgi:uncharacterized protein
MNTQRQNVDFSSGDERCRGWLFRPDDGVQPSGACIVMAHGFGLTRDAGLERYAERFVAGGFTVLAFDYRHFGDSDGEPRQLLAVGRQLEDWGCAIAFARTLDGVDPGRIGLWGTSFSGGHAVVTAANDGRVAAVAIQCPMLDAGAAARRYRRRAGIGAFLKLGLLSMADRLRAALGLSPLYIPIVGAQRPFAALAGEDVVTGYAALTPPHWRNEICARYALTLARYRPADHIEKVPCMLLMQVCLQDDVVPPSAAIEAAERGGKAVRLETYDCRHFEIYHEYFEQASSQQLEFFKSKLAEEDRMQHSSNTRARR